MDSNTSLEQSAPSAPHFSSEGQDQIANKKSHNKTIIILLSIFSIIATAAAVVFGVMYFTNQKPTDQPTPETSVQEEETEQAAEETEITDENLKKDLDEKISILYNISLCGPHCGHPLSPPASPSRHAAEARLFPQIRGRSYYR